MELYTLDPDTLFIDDIIEGYSSAIWTERYNSLGDLTMVFPSTPITRAKYVDDVLIVKNGSLSTKAALSTQSKSGAEVATSPSDSTGPVHVSIVMIIKTAESAWDDAGNYTLTVTCVSAEQILVDRIAKKSTSNLTSDPSWALTGTPSAIAIAMFKYICVDTNFNGNDSIPGLQYPGSSIEAGTIALPSGTITIQQNPDSLYNAISTICQAYGMGFHLYWSFDTTTMSDDSTNYYTGAAYANFFFQVFMGSDHTSVQSVNPKVIFGTDLDSLSAQSELRSKANYKNVAYVCGVNGAATVYDTANGYSSSNQPTLLDRHSLYVDASDVTLAAGTTLTATLQSRGIAALAANNYVAAFDSEMTTKTPFKYGTDYQLGDIIELQDADTGNKDFMQITEYIFTDDDQGNRGYPTLVLVEYVIPDSWYANALNGETWSGVPGTQTWNGS